MCFAYPFMMLSLGCQLEYICDQLTSNQLDMYVKHFLIWKMWGGKTHTNSVPHLVEALIKGHRSDILFVTWSPSFSLSNSSILSLKHSPTGLEPTSFGFQCRLKTSSSLGILSTPSTDWDYRAIQSWEWTTYCNFYLSVGNSIYIHTFHSISSVPSENTNLYRLWYQRMEYCSDGLDHVFDFF